MCWIRLRSRIYRFLSVAWSRNMSRIACAVRDTEPGCWGRKPHSPHRSFHPLRLDIPTPLRRPYPHPHRSILVCCPVVRMSARSLILAAREPRSRMLRTNSDPSLYWLAWLLQELIVPLTLFADVDSASRHVTYVHCIPLLSIKTIVATWYAGVRRYKLIRSCLT